MDLQYSIHTLTVAGERKNCSRCNKIQPSCNNSPFFVKYSWSIIYRPLFWGSALSIYKKNILKDCLCHSPNLIFFSCNTKKFQRQFNINKGGKEEQFINLFFLFTVTDTLSQEKTLYRLSFTFRPFSPAAHLMTT